MTPVIEARDVSKRFLLRHSAAAELKVRFLGLFDRRHRRWTEEFWALRGVSLQISRGESLGLIGRNGSGKSTLLKLIAGLHHPTGGHLFVDASARIGTMIELGVGFHGELSGRENVFLNAAIYGVPRVAIEARYADIVAYAGLEHFMDVPLKAYSSGMHMRLGFAVVASLNPDVLLIDEIFAVGDQDFQQKCMRTLKDSQAHGRTIIFVSHSPAAIMAICDRVCLLDRGEIAFDGPPTTGFARYENLVHSMGPDPEIGSRPDRRLRSGFRAQPADAGRPDAELDLAWHRQSLGGEWTACGDWAFAFLQAHGLRANHAFLEMGCGSLSAARHLLPYLEANRYWGFDLSGDLLFDGIAVELARMDVRPEKGHFIVNQTFDLSECPQQFDVAMAHSLFNRLPLHGVARCLASVIRQLTPGGELFVTWLDADDAFAPGAVEEPYRHNFRILAGICDALDAHAERIDGAGHPRGESVMRVTRQPRRTPQRTPQGTPQPTQ